MSFRNFISFQKLIDFFIEEIDLRQLAIVRIFFYSLLLIVLNLDDNNAILQYHIPPRELWAEHSFFKLLNLEIYPKYIHISLYWFWNASILACALGFISVVFLPLTGLLSLYFLGLEFGFICSNFRFYIPLFGTLLLAFSKAGTHYSIDSELFKSSKDSTQKIPDVTFRTMIFLISFMYFAASVSKLRYSGIEWVTQDYIGYHIRTAFNNFSPNIPDFLRNLIDSFIASPLNTKLLGVLTIAIEVSSPIVLFIPKLLKIYLILWIALHLGMYFMMGITTSIYLIPAVAFFIPYLIHFFPHNDRR